MRVETFCGGDFQTNGYYLPESGVLIDAPQDIYLWLIEQSRNVSELWLTHGHFDHILDAARIVQHFGCPVRAHSADFPMLDGRVDWRAFGLNIDVPALQDISSLSDGDTLTAGGSSARVLHVPGHSPGSICFYFFKEELLFCGDVLFAGGVGRWDLPGGDGSTLFRKIREKILCLPASTVILPGHGPSSTIRQELTTNPYLRESYNPIV